MRGRQRRGRIAAIGVGAVVVAAGLAGCGGEPEASSAAAPSTAPGVGVVTTAADGVQEITIQTQDDYLFTPDSFTVAPGKVRLTLLNAGKEMVHNLEFDEGEGPEPIEAGIDYLAAGDEETVEFEVTAPGDHPFTCTFHVQLGQVGTMTVQG
jgi:plastocyanin